MRNHYWKVLIAAVVVFGLCRSPVRAGLISITFDEPQLVNNDPVLDFYNGGMTFRGIVPGPNDGVTFTINARVFTQTGSLTGTFTKPGIMELFSDTARQGEPITATMNVGNGFTGGIVFDYAAIDTAGTLQIFSGSNGEGNVLANVNLAVTSPVTGPGIFVADSVMFNGTAQSVVFSGGNQQIAFDDLQIQTVPVPVPATWSLLSAGAVFYWGCALCRRANR
jgi:hypothetical protein